MIEMQYLHHLMKFNHRDIYGPEFIEVTPGAGR